MELYTTILTLTIVLSTDAEIVHEYVGIHGCSETDGEDMHELDEEEMWHADFNQKRGVVTLPDFANPLEFTHFYETSVIEMTGCKTWWEQKLNNIYASNAPHTSIYLKDDVELGVQNTLICHVTGFYPPSLSISWTTNNANVTEGISLSQYRPRADGTFNIFSTLKVTPAEGDIYSCTVNHRALQGQPQTKTWDVDVALPSVGPAVFCGVGLTLGLLGVAAGTFLLIKGNNCN
uniref:HLA class II histocompatibility antigen, DP alpha 1 chain-like n=1 Tax=Sinocyclocheilus grahami TaxID=75366 RepID=A0A672S4B3_SINGR